MSVVLDDIIFLRVDVIVNVVNFGGFGGGGVDGSIYRMVGFEFKRECEIFGGIRFGEVKIIGGYRLLAIYVIYIVGFILNRGVRFIVADKRVLISCYI